MSTSFRDWLKDRDDKGDVWHIEKEVDVIDEMGAIIARADYSGIEKIIQFDNPKGFDIPVVTNTVGGSTERIARSFGVDPEEESHPIPAMAKTMMETIQSGGIPPVYVDEGNAPVQEVVYTGDDIDLGMLPILRCNPDDGSHNKKMKDGRFITSLCISKPTEDARNLSYHRFEELGKDWGTVWVFRDTGDALSMEEFWGSRIDDSSSTHDPEKAKPFPVAYVFGVGPEWILTGGNTALPWKHNDFGYIGGLNGEPVEMVKCKTIDVDVPADAEIVVEGVFHPFKWEMQGRFASFNCFYDVSRRRPVLDITAITMRKKPIYQHVHIGLPISETNQLGGFFRGMKIYNDLKVVLPNLVDVFVDPAAGAGFTAHISINKARVGEPKLAMMRAYTTMQGFCKHVFVYDEDINIHDPVDRNWALAHRFLADRDLTIIPNVMGMILEPLAQKPMGSPAKLGLHDGMTESPLNVRAFMGVDCTRPLGIKMMDRVLRKPHLEKYVDEVWETLNPPAK
jgi:2,5-furandicarboxylate decarboxylase 1